MQLFAQKGELRELFFRPATFDADQKKEPLYSCTWQLGMEEISTQPMDSIMDNITRGGQIVQWTNKMFL